MRRGRRLVRIATRAVPVLLLVTFGTMLLVDLLPGDPAYAILGDGASQEQVAAVHAQLNYDASVPERYLDWLGAVVRGDLGTSLRDGKPVLGTIVSRIPVTLEVAVLSLLLAMALAIPAAIVAAHRPGGLFDSVSGALASLSISLPSYVSGFLLVYLLALKVKWFPVTGWTPLTQDPVDNLRHALLPSLTLALYEAPILMRVLRGDMITTLQSDFIAAARAKGLRPSRVLLRHALRPSSLSVVTLLGLAIGRLVGGTIIVESIFALPGMGALLIRAISSRDIVTVQGIVMVVAVLWVLINSLIDVIYGYLDPRIDGNAI